MPCNTITTATVELGRVDKVLLAEAMKELDLTQYSYNEQTGTLTVRGRNLYGDELAKVKQTYSKRVVMSQAKKFGWQVKQVGAFKWEVQR